MLCLPVLRLDPSDSPIIPSRALGQLKHAPHPARETFSPLRLFIIEEAHEKAFRGSGRTFRRSFWGRMSLLLSSHVPRAA